MCLSGTFCALRHVKDVSVFFILSRVLLLSHSSVADLNQTTEHRHVHKYVSSVYEGVGKNPICIASVLSRAHLSLSLSLSLCYRMHDSHIKPQLFAIQCEILATSYIETKCARSD